MYMQTYQLIAIALIVFYLWVLRDLRRKEKRFRECFTQAEEAIMQAARDNVHMALRCNALVERVKKQSFSHSTDRQVGQLVILWKSQFAHLFNH
jgi:hypothetical protein